MNLFDKLNAMGKPFENMLNGYPLYFVDGHTGVFKGSMNPTWHEWGDGGISTLWAHVRMDLDGDNCLDVEMFGNSPHDQGAFSWDMETWESVLGADGYGGNYDRTNALQWMLQHGIAPGMRVWLEVEVEWTGGGYYYPDDVDCSFSHRVMWREPWTPEQHAAAWEAYLARPSWEEENDE